MTVIHMRNVEGEPNCRALDEPLRCEMMDGPAEYIPTDFRWDGNSTPFLFQWMIPRHAHPVESAKHDYRSHKARNLAERRWADNEYRRGILKTKAPTKRQKAWLGVQSVAGYVGVSIGAFLGVGSNFTVAAELPLYDAGDDGDGGG